MFNRIFIDHASVCMMLLYVYFYSYVNVIVDLRLNKVYVRSFVRYEYHIFEKKVTDDIVFPHILQIDKI